MADAKRITIINNREGKLVLAPDADELKANPKAKERVVMAGRSLEVSAEEGARLLNLRGVVDAAKAVPSYASQLDELSKQLEDLKAENARLSKAAGKKEAAAAK